MSLFEKNVLSIDQINGDEAKLLAQHKSLWENGMMFSSNQWTEIITKLKPFETISNKAKCWTLLSEGTLYTFHPSLGNALEKLLETEAAFRAIQDKGGEGAAQACLVLYYKNLGQLEIAQDYVQKAISNIGDDLTYFQFLCITYYQAGELNHLLKDYEAAIRYYAAGLAKVPDQMSIRVRLQVGLAGAYKDCNEQEKAFDLFQQALKSIEGKGIPILESKIYADLANYYYRKSEYLESIAYHQKSIALRLAHKMKNPLITNYIELAEVHLALHNLEEALHYARLAEQLAEELNIVLKLILVYHVISKIHEALGNLSIALSYYKKYHLIKEEVFSQESARQIKELSMRHEMENMQKEKELFELRNVVLKQALEEIESSVRYAKRIQDAILPPMDLIRSKLPHTFVFYKPKDIVAGDFYWMEEINDCILIAAADCTGHSVPGAMVSVVCSNALNRAVKEFLLSDTGAILDKVTDLVLETFEKSIDDVKDGMDISLLAIHPKKGVVQWSGANNPLWYFDKHTMHEITADKQPIGKSDFRKPFTTHSFPYEPGAIFYLFTDGYADQFGGPKGKKMMYKRFHQEIQENLPHNMETQQLSLERAFENWRGDLEQVDDVCVIGVKLG